jgi:hypothetical protein
MQEQIDEIMDTFDFGRVHDAMTLLDWCWDIGEHAHIPDEAELRKCARRLLREAVDSKYTATGGFTAVRHGDIMSLFWGYSSP